MRARGWLLDRWRLFLRSRRRWRRLSGSRFWFRFRLRFRLGRWLGFRLGLG
ncbi:hypothetical protein [Longispora albida]|uniref:hypothetical protein n=1 Tax=Longispora albida TaxID=203523 RepID=UPI000369D1A5|nr:hypothetical protein [Longispora albida]